MSIFGTCCHFKLTAISAAIFLALSRRDNLTKDNVNFTSAHRLSMGQKVHSITHFGPLPETPAIPRFHQHEALNLHSSSASRLGYQTKNKFRAEQEKHQLALASPLSTVGALSLPTIYSANLLY